MWVYFEALLKILFYSVLASLLMFFSFGLVCLMLEHYGIIKRDVNNWHDDVHTMD